VSVKAGAPELLKPGCSLRQRQARRDAGCWCVSARRGLDRKSYHKRADASAATASQVAAQNPSDRSYTMVKDAPSDH
jgi:hypothetical protein